jgi:hypothetical protein
MRVLTKMLLSACTLCALGPGAARAQSNPSSQNPPPLSPPSRIPPPPIPTDSPGSPTDRKLPDPSTPGAPTTPTPPDNPAPTDAPNRTPTDAPSPTPTDAPSPMPTDTPTTPTTPDTSAVPTPPATPTATVMPDQPIDSGSETDIYSYSWYAPELSTGIGVSAILGGGVTGFTDKTMRSTTANAGGLWDLRVTLGSHLPLALDISYLGSATNINGLPTGNKGTLIGTTVEGALRYNVLPHYAFTPYVFGGVGWQRYDVTQTTVSLTDSGMNDHDNLLEFPMGAGLAYRTGGFVVDVRGTFRAAMDQNLVLTTPTLTPTSSDFAAMHTWEASAALGYEF